MKRSNPQPHLVLRTHCGLFFLGMAVLCLAGCAERSEQKSEQNSELSPFPSARNQPAKNVSTQGADAAEIEKGKMVFVRATCWGCHPHGENSMHGDKPLKGPEFTKKYPEDQNIVDFVRRGSPEEGMPPFPQDKLSDADLRSAIVYIRSLSKSDAN